VPEYGDLVATYKVILLPEALSELEALHAYIAKDSPGNAAKMAGRILDAIEKLAGMPRRYATVRTRRRLPYKLRSIVVRPYKVFYSVEGDAVYVRTIRHGARRPWP
jgi:plasmid stabilization system protein ParE